MLTPASPLAWEPLRADASRKWLLWTTPLVTALLVVLVAPLWVVPYVALAPGSARQIDDLVKVPADRAHPPKGEILLTTVAFQGRMTAADVFFDWLDPDVDVFKREELLGKATPTQFRQQNLQQIDDSKQTAVVVALRRLGHEVGERGEGTLVEAVVPDTPADGVLEPGDVITSVDRTPTPLGQEARRLLGAHRPGDLVTLEVLPGGQEPKLTKEVRLGQRDGGLPFLGVQLRTHRLQYDMPFDVEIDSLGIGGPSAGLAFALQVMDSLTPGELTGGRRIAVTGEIGPGGEVGAIGGIAQKVAAVEREGADVFLVPRMNFEIAKDRADGDLKVIAVGTLEDALAALKSVGGDLSAIGPPPGPPDAAR